MALQLENRYRRYMTPIGNVITAALALGSATTSSDVTQVNDLRYQVCGESREVVQWLSNADNN